MIFYPWFCKCEMRMPQNRHWTWGMWFLNSGIYIMGLQFFETTPCESTQTGINFQKLGITPDRAKKGGFWVNYSVLVCHCIKAIGTLVRYKSHLCSCTPGPNFGASTAENISFDWPSPSPHRFAQKLGPKLQFFLRKWGLKPWAAPKLLRRQWCGSTWPCLKILESPIVFLSGWQFGL